MTSRRSRSASLATRVASLLLLAGGALVLMADSSECPDGYSAASFEASFRSTCPSTFAPPEGTLRISLAKGSNADGVGLQRDLSNAGFKVSGTEDHRQGSGDGICSQNGFVMSSPHNGSPTNQLRCGSVRFDLPVQEVTCNTSGVTPSALQVGRRDINDGAAEDAEAGDATSSDASVANDSGLVRPPADSGLTQPPVESCTITFTKLGS